MATLEGSQLTGSTTSQVPACKLPGPRRMGTNKYVKAYQEKRGGGAVATEKPRPGGGRTPPSGGRTPRDNAPSGTDDKPPKDDKK